MKKRYIRWTLWTLATPFLLFFVLCVLIYLPPVQNYVVKKATVYASEATGMHITVGRISLSFPLNLVATEVEAASLHQDTLLSVQRLQVNVQLLPLLRKQVEVDGVALNGATVNSNDLINGLTVKGRVGELFIASHGVALDPETAVVDKVLLKDTDLSVCLNDTTAADTTATDTTYWKIRLDRIDLQNVSLALDMPLDSLSLRTSLQEASLRDGFVDLHRSAYTLRQFRIAGGQLSYENEAGRALTDTLPAAGFDPAHVALTHMDVQLDSLHYEGQQMKAVIRQFAWQERSGLQLVSTEGRLESDGQLLRLPVLRLRTSDSYLEMNATLPWTLLEQPRRGNLSARLMADIGKPDVMRLAGHLDETFVQRYPTEPLRLRAGVDGDEQQLKLTALYAELPGALDISANGELNHWTDSVQRAGDFTLQAGTEDLKFLSALMPGVEVPYGLKLDGRLTMAGTRMGADLLLKQAQAQVRAEADTIPITVYNDTVASPDDFRMERAARLYARYDLANERYEAAVAVNDFDLHAFLPADSLYTLSTRLNVKGEGFDFFSPRTWLDGEGRVDRLHYGHRILSGMDWSAGLHQSNVRASLLLKNWMADAKAHLEGTLKHNAVTADLKLDIAHLDWQALRLMDYRFETAQHIGVRLSSDLKQRHQIDAEMTQTQITTAKRRTQPKDLFAGLSTSVDSTRVYLRAGDLNLSVDAEGGLEHLSAQANVLLDKLARQWQDKHIDHQELRSYLPGVCLRVSSGADNPVANYLSLNGLSYQKLYMDMDSSPLEGLNGEAYLYGLRSDSLVLDTLFLDVQQDVNGVNLLSGVISGPKPGQEGFDVTLEGSVGNSNAQLLVQYLNARKEQGVYLGVMADLHPHGIRMQLFPEHPTLVYRPFTVNPDNYIYLADKGRVHANVSVYDGEGSGLSFYTNREDTTARQDMTLELSKINLKEFRRILPYMPDMEGWIGAAAHYIDSGTQMMLSSDLSISDFKYEGSALGSWEIGGVYLPGEADDHHVDAYVRHNDEEIAHLGGIYLPTADGNGSLTADVAFEHFPLNVVNPFVPDRMVELTGDIDGTLGMKGNPSKPMLNGSLALDSVSFFLPDMSARFRLDNEPVQIVDSKLRFQQFDIFTQGKTPFTIDGEVDFSNLEQVTTDLRMHAENYELLNAPRTKRAMVYGKMYVDFNATLRGPVETLMLRGNMNVLGNTDVTYVLKDSPLAVNDRLGDMVTFVNFNDTTAVEDTLQAVSLSGVDVAMSLHIDQAVQARVDLVADGSNYMLLEGGGDLSFQYTAHGDMRLTGRYSLISGEMKYEIPVIPLKTFNIRNGSYVEWTGNVMNPQLNITATERVRASVGESGKAGRMVGFDVGIALSQRLENLGLAFTLSAPDDASVQDQLNAMSVEERGKLAVTMLVTGMYMAEGNSTGGFNMNNALNSFLQSEISNIAGKALDINLGMETVDNADGAGKRTDYNFQFAKRFWNNRFRIVIGGKVSTGNTVQQDETFIDNVSIEYRLDNSGTRYVKLFHDKNYESVLEGEIIETGVGIVLRKKMSHLGELFIFQSKKKK